MKFSILICGIASTSFHQAIAATLSHVEAEQFCGSLGVMNTTNLPAGIDSQNVRICADHPLGKDISLDETVDNAPLDERKGNCWFKHPVGCTRGYCWKSCAQPGSGAWCWTADNNGFGSWYTCKSDGDCTGAMACGAGDCYSCGCSC